MESENLVWCLKISQPQWIEKLQSGEAWFGAINNYITKAEKTNNNEQGDRFEGVFAHLPKNALRVHECKARFGDDLEIIDDGDFCFLRRRSARFHYAFCMYGVKNTELLPLRIKIGKSGMVEEIRDSGRAKLQFPHE